MKAEVLRFEGKAALQQRVLPAYRVPFFERLAQACAGGMELFAGEPRPGEAIHPAREIEHFRLVRARNLHLLGGGFYLCYQQGLLPWLERWDPDVLILEGNPRYLASPAAVRWMHRRGRPVIAWGLGAPGAIEQPRSLRNRRRAAYLRQFDALIAYSELGALQYRALGFPAETLFVAPNAVVEASPKPPDRQPPLGRPLRLIFVGRLQRRKRLDLLLRACAALGDPVDLTIVGDGPQSAALKRLAADVFPQATFTGALHGEALKRTLREADLFVLPGTGGLAIQQAMAEALPVIAAEGDGTQQDLVRPENGWLVQPGDFESLRAALVQALASAEQLPRMGAESHRLARERFNLQSMAAVFVEAMQAVVGVH